MLDEKDLQAIAKIMDEKIASSEERMTGKIMESEERMTAKIMESEERMTAKIMESEERMTGRMDQKLAEQRQDLIQCMNGISESDIMPKFNLLADGIKDIQEKLVPRSRVDDLEDEMKFLKLMCRQMAEDIAKLKKAN